MTWIKKDEMTELLKKFEEEEQFKNNMDKLYIALYHKRKIEKTKGYEREMALVYTTIFIWAILGFFLIHFF